MGYFLPLCTLTAWKINIFKKFLKSPGDIIILHKCTKNYYQMMYGSWDMVRDRYNYFSFWAIFCPFTPVTARKVKIKKKMKKLPGDIIILRIYVYQKLRSDVVWFLRYGARQMDRQIDGQKKWHIEEGTPPKKCNTKIWSEN